MMTYFRTRGLGRHLVLQAKQAQGDGSFAVISIDHFRILLTTHECKVNIFLLVNTVLHNFTSSQFLWAFNCVAFLDASIVLWAIAPDEFKKGIHCLFSDAFF